MLHQLQKKVFKDLINMTLAFVANLNSEQRVTKQMKKKDRAYKNSLGIVQLNAQFRQVPRYPGLKHFHYFSYVQQ